MQERSIPLEGMVNVGMDGLEEILRHFRKLHCSRSPSKVSFSFNFVFCLLKYVTVQFLEKSFIGQMNDKVQLANSS